VPQCSKDDAVASLRAVAGGHNAAENSSSAAVPVDSTLAKLPVYLAKRVADRKHGFESRGESEQVDLELKNV
jgi:hypothetical protein